MRIAFLLGIFVSCLLCASAAFALPQQENIKHFPKNFEKDFVGVFSSRSNIYPALGGFIGSELAHNLWDPEVHRYFRDKDRIRNIRSAGNFIGGPLFTSSLTGGVFALSQFVGNQKFHSMGYALAEGFVLNSGLTEAFKFSVRRMRPDLSNRRSFLSGHVSSIVTISTVLGEYYGWKAAVPAGITSAIVATARLGSNRHFLSDVVAGATLGYIVGRTVSHNHLERHPNILFMPSVSPTGKGAGFVLMARF